MKHVGFKTLMSLMLACVLACALALASGCGNNQSATVPPPSGKAKTAAAPKATAAPKADESAKKMVASADNPHASAGAPHAAAPEIAPDATMPPGHPTIDMSGGEAAAPSFKTEAPPADRPRLAADTATVKAEVAGLNLTVPAAWEAVPKEQLSTMRAAQYTIPAAAGDAQGGEMIAYAFGPGQGGPATMNIERWLRQMTLDEGVQPVVYQSSVGELKVMELYAEGTLLPSSMGAGPKEAQAGSAIYGVVIEGGPKGSVFLKLTGPKALVTGVRPAMATLVETLSAAE